MQRAAENRAEVIDVRRKRRALPGTSARWAGPVASARMPPRARGVSGDLLVEGKPLEVPNAGPGPGWAGTGESLMRRLLWRLAAAAPSLLSGGGGTGSPTGWLVASETPAGLLVPPPSATPLLPFDLTSRDPANAG